MVPLILTITLNPALDKLVAVPALRAGEANRVELLSTQPAGKGVDVAKVLRDMGGPGLRDRVPGRRGGQRLQRFSVPGGHRERLCPHRGLHPHQSSDFRRGRRAHRAARAGALRHVGRMGRPAGCSGQPPAPLRGRRPVRQRAGRCLPRHGAVAAAPHESGGRHRRRRISPAPCCGRRWPKSPISSSPTVRRCAS